MKRRDGFVSNSSSSSFIIGIGVVTDLGKFKSACKKKGLSINDKWDGVSIEKLSKIISNSNEYGSPKVVGSKEKLIIYSFNDISVELDYSNMNKDTMIATMDMVGELDDDNSFWNGDEYNYDKSPTDEDCDKMSIFTKENGIKVSQVFGGAGRNG